MTDSRTLLAEYVQTASEGAFQELVSRYIGLVYSTALRLVGGDTHLAQDVAQTVFAHLARKASSLSTDVMLGGWLHRDACNVAAKVVRSERRRQVRERQAMEIQAQEDHTQANLARVAPILDEAINQLGDEDRAAILLRFFEERDLCSVGAALGTSEDAARMRVNRALDKLHLLLRKRGIAFSTTALATALATEAVTAVPVGLAANVTGTALVSVAAGGTVTATILKLMTLTKLKIGIIGGLAIAGVAAPLVFQHQSQVRLREENQSLRQQVEQLAQLSTENEHLSNLLTQANGTQAFFKDQLSELLRLRGEVGRLRQESKEAERLRQENAQLRTASARGLPGTGAVSPTNSSTSQPLYTRPLIVNADKMLQQFKSSMSETEGESSSQFVRRFLKDKGIEIDPPKSVFLDQTNGTLWVRANLLELDKIENLLLDFPPDSDQQAVSTKPSNGVSTEQTSSAEAVQQGKLLLEAGKLDEAEAKLKEVIKQDPGNRAAYYYLNLVAETRYKKNL